MTPPDTDGRHTPFPTWLIEVGVYGYEIQPLAAEIRRQGMRCEDVS